MADFFELNPVEDVNKATYKYIKEHWGAKFFVPVFSFPLLAVAEAYYFGAPRVFHILMLVWVIGGYAWAQSIARKGFMMQFAKANGLHYIGEGDVELMTGKLFDRGHSKNISHLTEGEIRGHLVKFFNYDFSVGHGKEKRTYNYWVTEVTFKGEAPDIVIESRSDWDFSGFSRDHQKEMPVEGFFKKHFAVYVPEDFEIETLEIFTPEVMEQLVLRSKMYNFEFIGDKLYIFKMGYISKMSELREFFSTADYLVSTIAPRIFRLSDDVRAMKKINNNGI